MRLPERLKKGCVFSDDPRLAALTTAGVGGSALALAEPLSREAMVALVSFLLRESVPFRIIGGGSNVLAPDAGFPGVLVGTRRISGWRVQPGQDGRLTAEAGMPLPRLLALCARLGLSGAEGLAGIPGTVGGAAAMNAGGRYGSIGDIVDAATVVGRDGAVRALLPEECGFRYRGSTLEGAAVVLDVTVRLTPGRPDCVRDRMATILGEKERSQPLRERSCGCMFKNPPGLHAARLIDQAGLKGLRCGGASISAKHAGFMVNEGGARSSDFETLIAAVRDAVRCAFGVELELEVRRW